MVISRLYLKYRGSAPLALGFSDGGQVLCDLENCLSSRQWPLCLPRQAESCVKRAKMEVGVPARSNTLEIRRNGFAT